MQASRELFGKASYLRVEDSKGGGKAILLPWRAAEFAHLIREASFQAYNVCEWVGPASSLSLKKAELHSLCDFVSLYPVGVKPVRGLCPEGGVTYGCGPAISQCSGPSVHWSVLIPISSPAKGRASFHGMAP